MGKAGIPIGCRKGQTDLFTALGKLLSQGEEGPREEGSGWRGDGHRLSRAPVFLPHFLG